MLCSLSAARVYRTLLHVTTALLRPPACKQSKADFKPHNFEAAEASRALQGLLSIEQAAPQGPCASQGWVAPSKELDPCTSRTAPCMYAMLTQTALGHSMGLGQSRCMVTIGAKYSLDLIWEPPKGLTRTACAP